MPHPRYLQRVQKLRQWFHGQARKAGTSKPTTRSLFAIKTRAPARITRAQAYSLLFCKTGTLLHTEQKAEHKLYCAGDKDTVDKYQHLFKSGFNPKIDFIAFQQVVLRQRIASIPAEELLAVDSLIDKRYEDEKSHSECPWSALKTGESQTEADLKREYIKRFLPPPY